MIITGLLCRISDGNRVRRYLLTTDPYHDPALAGQIEYGTALPVIPTGAGLSWGEEIFFQPQGGSNNINVSDVPIINDGRFDDWGGWAFAGLDQILGRGEHDQPFSEWQQFHFVGRGKPEFQGRRIIIGLRDRFAYMREPVAQQVFPDTVANDRLINTTVPMVFGAAYQVRPLLTDPQILKYAVGTNVNDVPQVQEGGNPSTPVFVFVPNGFQLFQSPSLQITCNVSGPPLPEWEEADALINIGQFNDWTDDKPDGWIVTEDAPWSVISETIDGDARVESTAQIDGDTGWIGANLWESGATAEGLSWSPVPGTDSLTDVLQSDDGTYARHVGLDYRTHWLIGTGFTFGLTEDVAPVELDVRVTLENDGGGQPIVQALYVKFPDSTVRNLLPGGVNFIPGTKDTLQFKVQNPPSGVYRFTNDILQDPEFQLWIVVQRSTNNPAGNQDVRIYEMALRCHFGPIIDRLRMTTEDDVLTPGNRYLMRIRTLGDSSDSIRAYWGGADDELQSLIEIDDPFAQTTSVFEGEEEAEFSFVANGPRFAIEFDRGEGNGEQTIEQIEVIDQSASRERYSDLMQYIHETADKDPEVVCDIASYDAVESFTGNPRLGWYVSDQTTREQLATLLSHSLGATSFGATTGQWKAAQMRIPSQPGGDYLSVVGSFGESQAFPDEGDDLRDRVHAARNVHPLRESETAGVTTTWPEEQRQQVIDEWRITERADFDDLEGFPGDTDEPLSIVSIDPNTGDQAGGTEVTLTGTGFAEFDEGEGDAWTIGGNPVTGITVVSDTELTGETPAGTGSADVVVTIGEKSATLIDGFEYEAAGAIPEWHNDDQKTQQATSAGSYNIQTPDNVSAGDLLVFIAFGFRSDNDAEITTPDGFNTELEFSGSSATLGYIKIATRVADGDEPAQYSYATSGGAFRHNAVLGRVTGSAATGSVGEISAGESAGTDSFDTPSINVPGNSLLICGTSIGSGVDEITIPASMGLIVSLKVQLHEIAVAKEDIQQSGETGVRTWATNSNRDWVGFAMEIKS